MKNNIKPQQTSDQTASSSFSLPDYLCGADKMIDDDPPPVNWLFIELVERAIIAILTGAGSVGKSLFSMQMAACVATGLPFLGKYLALPAPILYLSIEESRAKFHQRFSQMLVGMQAQLPALGDDHIELLRRNFRSACLEEIPFDLSLKNGTKFGNWLYSLCDNINPSIIVLDPLVYFLNDENSNSETKVAYQFLLKLAVNGPTILINHHLRKDAMNDKSGAIGQAAARGAGHLVLGSKWAVNLGKNKNGDRQLDIVKDNYSGNQDSQISIELTTVVNECGRTGWLWKEFTPTKKIDDQQDNKNNSAKSGASDDDIWV